MQKDIPETVCCVQDARARLPTYNILRKQHLCRALRL